MEIHLKIIQRYEMESQNNEESQLNQLTQMDLRQSCLTNPAVWSQWLHKYGKLKPRKGCLEYSLNVFFQN